MHYQIARNGQMYGPYTMEDLQRYVASGHVLPTDLAKSEEMSDWIPVSQLLGTQAAAAPGTPAAGPAGASAAAAYPAYAPGTVPYSPGAAPASGVLYADPPNLHWAVLLLLDIVTCSLFQMVWNIILAAWFRRVMPSSKALALYIGSAVLLFLQAGSGQILGITMGHGGYHHGNGFSYGYGAHPGTYGIYGLITTVCWIIRLVARFTFRSELEQHYNNVEPMGLRINPVLTFFFGGIYLQSQMNRINDMKRVMRFR